MITHLHRRRVKTSRHAIQEVQLHLGVVVENEQRVDEHGAAGAHHRVHLRVLLVELQGRTLPKKVIAFEFAEDCVALGLFYGLAWAARSSWRRLRRHFLI